jgi:ABC-2 type transport system permease protein
MDDNSKSVLESLPRLHFFNQSLALCKWSLLRHKIILPMFTILQVILSVAIVYGLALLIPDIDPLSAVYLSSGATTLGLIAVGCVLAAQIVSTAKQDGIIKYQRTLPVSRINILITDFFIWGLASLPGVIMSFLAAAIRFGIAIHFSFQGFVILLLVQMSMISIGFAIAYWLNANSVSMMSQLIMIGGLLFSPITYPAERLPDWITDIYNILPFVPTSSLIRASFYQLGQLHFRDIIVVSLWLVVTSSVSLIALERRD